MRILYVEDNPANLFLVKRVARMGNHDVINFIDGEEALRKIDNVKPDLILMDIQLAGGLTGLDVVKQLRADGFDRPIIAVTAYAMVGDKERCIEAGCDDYMPKPIPISRLVELFQHYQLKTDARTASSGAAVPVEAPAVAIAAVKTATVETATTNGKTESSAVVPSPAPESTPAEKPAEPVTAAADISVEEAKPPTAAATQEVSPLPPVPPASSSVTPAAPVEAPSAPAVTPATAPEAPVAPAAIPAIPSDPASSITVPAAVPAPDASQPADLKIAEVPSIPQRDDTQQKSENSPAAAESVKITPESS